MPRNDVEFADRLSRKRPWGILVATGYFLLLQFVVRPAFGGPAGYASSPRIIAWIVNVVVLLVLLLPISGFVWGARVRQLVHDDVSRANSRSACSAGFWVAMASSLVTFSGAEAWGLTPRDVAYVVITASTGVALLAFAWLELRAQRDG